MYTWIITNYILDQVSSVHVARSYCENIDGTKKTKQLYICDKQKIMIINYLTHFYIKRNSQIA